MTTATKPAYTVTTYRCECCPGVRYRKAADGHWWATKDDGTRIPGQVRYATDELGEAHEPIPVAVDNQEALLEEASALRVAHYANTEALAAQTQARHEAAAQLVEAQHLLALHRMVSEGGIDSLITRLNTAEATVERVKALAAWAAQPSTAVAKTVDGYTYTHDQITVEDGGLLLVGESAAYVRTDGDTPPADGDWWMLDGSPDGDGPRQLAEVLVSRHDEDTDRPAAWHKFEALLTADMLTDALTEKA